MTDKAIKLSLDPYIRFEEFLAVTPTDLDAYAKRNGDLGGDTSTTLVTGILGKEIVGDFDASNVALRYDPEDDKIHIGPASGGDGGPVIYEPGPDSPPDISPTGTVSSDSNFGGEVAGNAVDGSEDCSKWTSNSSPAWIQLDWASDKFFSGYKLRLAGNCESSGYNLNTWQWQWWNFETSEWIIGDTVSGNSDNNPIRTFDTRILAKRVRLYITNTGSDSHARLPMWANYGYEPVEFVGVTLGGYPITNDPSDGDIPIFHDDESPHFEYGPSSGIPEFESPPSPLPNLALVATATADSTYSGSYLPTNANNENLTDQWVSADTTPPHWIEYELPYLCRISRWRTYHELTSGYTTIDFTLQGWNETDSDWDDLDVVTGNSSADVTRTFTNYDTTKVRIYITDPGSVDNAARLYEWELYGYELIATGYKLLEPLDPNPTGDYNWGSINEYGQVTEGQDVETAADVLTNVTGSDPIIVTGTGHSRALAFTPGASVSFQGQEVTNVKLENLTSDPTGSIGRIYANTSSKKIKAYINALWQEFITDQTPLGGALTGTVGSAALATVVSADTVSYPASIQYNAAGQITAATAGATPVGYFSSTQSTGSTIPIRTAVAQAGTGAIKLADASAANQFPAIGFTTAAITTGGSGSIQNTGVLSGFSGLTPGATYYSDPATPGGITSTMPVTSGQLRQVVGMALSATTLLLDIEQAIISGSAISPLAPAFGTVFPGSPNLYDRFYRTDRGYDYLWNGTNWVTVMLLTLDLESTGSSVNNTNYTAIFPRYDYSVYIESIQVHFKVQSMGGGGVFTVSDYWSVQPGYVDVAGTTHLLGSPMSLWLSGRTTDHEYFVSVPYDTTLASPALSDSNAFGIGYAYTKTGSPGAYSASPGSKVYYRLVG